MGTEEGPSSMATTRAFLMTAVFAASLTAGAAAADQPSPNRIAPAQIAPAQIAQAGKASTFVLENGCKTPVRALVHLVDPARDWRTFGWYTIEPGGKTKPHETRNRYVYYYGETADGARKFDKGGDGTRRVRVGAEVYTMVRVDLGERFRAYTQKLCGR